VNGGGSAPSSISEIRTFLELGDFDIGSTDE
jgi:hypothetical protein